MSRHGVHTESKTGPLGARRKNGGHRGNKNWDSAAAKSQFLMEEIWLEVEADLAGYGTRRDVVRAAEGREEVVEHVIVRQVDYGEAHTPFVPIAVEQIVVADGEVKQVT